MDGEHNDVFHFSSPECTIISGYSKSFSSGIL